MLKRTCFVFQLIFPHFSWYIGWPEGSETDIVASSDSFSQCFLSRFWVSIWHTKILQWHTEFWSLDMLLPFIEVKKFLRKACFPARGCCNRRLQCCRLTHFSGAEGGSETCQLGVFALSHNAHRFGLLLYCHRFVQYGVRNCESTSMHLWKCFTVSPLGTACLAMHQTTIKT